MNRARFGVVATLVAVTVGVGSAQQAPNLTPVLAGKKFATPIKGQADVEFTKANVEPLDKKTNLVVATFYVKNMSDRPIARLTVDDAWYDDKGQVVTGGKGVIAGLLNPGEVKEMRIETTFNPRMKTNNWSFSHANGTVVPKQVDMMDGLPEDAKIGGKPVPKPKPTS